MITTTALVDAGRQIAAWLDRTLRDNDQADADVQYIQSIAAPETQLAVAVTQRENQHATSSTNTSNDLNTDLDTSGSNIQSTSAAIEKISAVDSATAWKAYQVALASLDEGAATTAVDKAYQPKCVSIGFTSPTLHGSDLVGRAKEDVASGESEPRTIVRMALVPMALPGDALR
ncbi:MAG: hypothetical protein J0M26_27015 [Planctomycetes bacterium]|nr:hypothetical protein [Planctomycetota bacterium]